MRVKLIYLRYLHKYVCQVESNIFKLRILRIIIIVHLEIITKTKELNCYNETITSDELKVKERRAAIAEMELQKHNFDQSLVIWEKILEEKSRVLEKEKENMVSIFKELSPQYLIILIFHDASTEINTADIYLLLILSCAIFLFCMHE